MNKYFSSCFRGEHLIDLKVLLSPGIVNAVSNMIALVILALLGALYIAGAHRLRVRSRWHAASFAAAWTVLVTALAPPLHELAEMRLWAHMVQHELLIVLAAPLLALARPHRVLLASLPRKPRRLAGRCLRRMRLSMPVAWSLHALVFWLWHIPALYAAAANQPLLHAVQHAGFFGSALLFWWAVLERRAAFGAAALYTFATALHTGFLGALLFLAPRPWYPPYAAAADALEDQQLAGLIMWVPGGVILALTALLLFWRWLDDMERRGAVRERLAPQVD